MLSLKRHDVGAIRVQTRQSGRTWCSLDDGTGTAFNVLEHTQRCDTLTLRSDEGISLVFSEC